MTEVTDLLKNFWDIVESSVRDSQNVIPERLYKAALQLLSKTVCATVTAANTVIYYRL